MQKGRFEIWSKAHRPVFDKVRMLAIIMFLYKVLLFRMWYSLRTQYKFSFMVP